MHELRHPYRLGEPYKLYGFPRAHLRDISGFAAWCVFDSVSIATFLSAAFLGEEEYELLPR